eukprot:g1571.t1
MRRRAGHLGPELLGAGALSRLRHVEMERTHAAMSRLVASMGDYEAAYIAVGRRLAVAEAKLAEREKEVGSLKAEVAALSETLRLTETSKDHRAGIKAAEKKNAKLKSKQYQSSLNTLSAKVEKARKRLESEKTFSELRERKFKAELNARKERITKLQKTVKNLTDLRASEDEKHKKKVEAAQAKQKAAHKSVSEAKSQMTALKERAEAAEAAVAKAKEDIADRNDILKKTAGLLREEVEKNAALRGELARAVKLFDERLRETTSSFVEALKKEREWRTEAVRGVGRLNSVVENKAGWLDVMSTFVTPPLDDTRTGKAVNIALRGAGAHS